jgi:hypothetical protein
VCERPQNSALHEGATKIKKGKVGCKGGSRPSDKRLVPPKLNGKWDVTSNHEFIARAPSEEEPRGNFLLLQAQTLFRLGDTDGDLVRTPCSDATLQMLPMPNLTSNEGWAFWGRKSLISVI